MPARAAVGLGTLAVITLVSLCAAISSGSVMVAPHDVWLAVTGGGASDTAATVIRELRMPRAAAGFVTGGLLALAGALMQVLLRNPLADPYVLGISGGAAVGALGSTLLGLGAFWMSGSAFAGAAITMVLVFGLSHGHGGWTPTRLLLNGVVVAAGWGAVVSFLLSVGPPTELRGMLFWLMGDLAGAGSAGWPAAVLAIGLAATLAVARDLNLLARGELQAQALGVAIGRLRLLIYVLASLLTATAVTVAGTVGFVGLVVPHLLRLVMGSDHRVLLPGCVLLGGSFIVLADTLARTAFAPQQLPVGVFSAFIGVPVFLFLLYRGGRGAA
ncbi:iron ABC transporter permease [Arhodomonas aquaeolei]|uniref:FecCD family ABC transporter permease n=1 Tax=Arhodomonas aquaeolei TaxID=2369 RepID=UPI00216744A3|nr:iron ABC transporter permease [Arhodomonas aquaeolei]MCS4505235.1 iron ABC transporter permease [Arhodomonas aquaeolei]